MEKRGFFRQCQQERAPGGEDGSETEGRKGLSPVGEGAGERTVAADGNKFGRRIPEWPGVCTAGARSVGGRVEETEGVGEVWGRGGLRDHCPCALWATMGL